MRALYNRVQTKDPTWKLAGFIVDDPLADVNTIRLAVTLSFKLKTVALKCVPMCAAALKWSGVPQKHMIQRLRQIHVHLNASHCAFSFGGTVLN